MGNIRFYFVRYRRDRDFIGAKACPVYINFIKSKNQCGWTITKVLNPKHSPVPYSRLHRMHGEIRRTILDAVGQFTHACARLREGIYAPVIVGIRKQSVPIIFPWKVFLSPTTRPMT